MEYWCRRFNRRRDIYRHRACRCTGRSRIICCVYYRWIGSDHVDNELCRTGICMALPGSILCLLLQLYLWRKQSLSVMIKPRHGLMSPSPIRPSPNMNQRNNLLPKDFFQEPSHFRNRQGHRSPRLRLNAVKLWKEPLPFFRRSDGIPCARMTVKKAWATMAKVMCRCHPVHERTS